MKAIIATIALISSLTAMSAEVIATGPLRVWTESQNVVVKFQGPAAEVLFKNLKNVKEEVLQEGCLARVVRVGRDVTCEREAGFVVIYSCEMKIDDTGAAVQ
jgi:hypothetical protein